MSTNGTTLPVGSVHFQAVYLNEFANSNGHNFADGSAQLLAERSHRDSQSVHLGAMQRSFPCIENL